MDPGLLIPIGVALLLAATYVIDAAKSARRERAEHGADDLFAWVGDRLGFERIERGTRSLEGVVDGVKVLLDVERGEDPTLRISLGNDDIPRSLVMARRRASLGDRPTPRVARRTGDPEFDEAVTLLGRQPDIASAVTPEVRRIALEALAWRGARVDGGEVLWEGPLVGVPEGELVARLPSLIQLARALRKSQPSASRLHRLLQQETCPPMAGLVAEQLFVHHPRSKWTSRAAGQLADHPSARARLYAALRGAEGGTGLLESMGGDPLDERFFRRALEWAAERLDARTVADAALEALTLQDDELRLAACRLLGRLGSLDAIGPLHRLSRQRRLLDVVKEAAEQAAATIHRREGGDEAMGALALSADRSRDGALELADGPGDGGLELVEPEG